MSATTEQLDLVAEAIARHRGGILLGHVGEGAFKRTYKFSSGEGQPLALKVYRAELVSERVHREIAAARRCIHPNIVRTHEVDALQVEDITWTYSIEEFIDGGSLESRLASSRLGVPEVIRLIKDVLGAVGHIAALDLVHRDIKPANVMLRLSGEPVLVDFGLVRDLGKSSLTKTWAPHGPGTPFYSAPEQLTNEKPLIDWRTDQFAVGVMVAEALGCPHPYSRGDGTRFLERVAMREGPEPSHANMPAAIASIVQRMVAPWPVRRFRTPELLFDAWNGLT